MNFDEVPWDRIVHFYGRASDLPGLLADLATGRHASAEKMLLEKLEHQDGVIQATPIAVHFILQAVAEGRVRDRFAIAHLLRRIVEAARFQLETSGPPSHPMTIEQITAPDSLWPPFESEETDEMLWEEWNPSDNDLAGWASLTEQMIVAGGSERDPFGPSS